MCGICGMVGISNKELLASMCQTLTHRGPDDFGTYVGHHAAIGVRRLSIIDLPNGHQPITNEAKTLWVIFNGEIYNFQLLRQMLEKRGYRFNTDTDTEVILRSYEEYGSECVRLFNGMFAFAIWDEIKRELFIARDRLGIKPLYYWDNGRYILFGSEIKAILQDQCFERSVNPTALYNYLSRLFVPGNATMFKGIQKLLPGHTLTCTLGINGIVSCRTTPYWKLDFVQKSYLSESDYCEGILENLENSVKRRVISDVSVGAFLSGGIDSSSIVSIATNFYSKPLKTFSLGFEKTDTTIVNELSLAKQAAKHFKTKHHEVTIGPNDLLTALPKMLWHLDQPYAGGLPQYFLSSIASKYTKVVLSGLGADELFGNYGRGEAFANYHAESLDSTFLKLPNSLQRLLDITSPTTRSLAKLYADWESPFIQKDKLSLCSPDILGQVNKQQTLEMLFQHFFDDQYDADLLDKLTYVDMKTQLVDEYLHYTDALSMAHSLEVRVPYLDHELVEFVAKIPYSVRNKPNYSKYLLKMSLAETLPTNIIHRPKMGFSLPIRVWLQHELRFLIDWLLSPTRISTQGYFDPKFVNTLTTAFYKEKTNDEDNNNLWNLIMFELWHKIFIEDTAFSEIELLTIK